MKTSPKPPAPKKLSPWDFLNSINAGKRGDDLLKDCTADSNEGADRDSPDKAYTPFIINRGLSYFIDSILFANAMNERAVLPAKMQFDFLRLAMQPRKRFSKWLKRIDDTDDVALLMAEYDYSAEKARDALSLYPEEELVKLRTRHDKGGSGKKTK